MSNGNVNTLSEDQKKALDLAATLDGLKAGSDDYDVVDSQLNDLWFGSNFSGRRNEWLESLGYQKVSTTADEEPVDQTVVETDNVEVETDNVEVETDDVKVEEEVEVDPAKRAADIDAWFRDNVDDVALFSEKYNDELGVGATSSNLPFTGQYTGADGIVRSVPITVYETADSQSGMSDMYIRQEAYQDHGEEPAPYRNDEGYLIMHPARPVVGGAEQGELLNVGRPKDYSYDSKNKVWRKGWGPLSEGEEVLKYDEESDTYTGVEGSMFEDPVIANSFGHFLDEKKDEGHTGDYEWKENNRRTNEIKNKFFPDQREFNEDGEEIDPTPALFDATQLAYDLETDSSLPNLHAGRWRRLASDYVDITLPDGTQYSVGHDTNTQWWEINRKHNNTKNRAANVIMDIQDKYADEDWKLKASEPMWGMFDVEDDDTIYGAANTYSNFELIKDGLAAALYFVDGSGVSGFQVMDPQGEVHEFDGHSELQSYLWNTMTKDERQLVNEWAVNRVTVIEEELDTLVNEHVGNVGYEVEDDPDTMEDETVYSLGIIEQTFSEGSSEFEELLYKDLSEEASAYLDNWQQIQRFGALRYLPEFDERGQPITNVTRAQHMYGIYRGFLDWDFEADSSFLELPESQQEEILKARDKALAFIDIKSGETIDGVVSKERNLQLEKLLEQKYGHDADLYRGVIMSRLNAWYEEPQYYEEDVINEATGEVEFEKGELVQGTGIYITSAEKALALKEKGDALILAAETESQDLTNTIMGYLDQVADAGFGYHSEGSHDAGTYRIVIDAPEGDEFESKRNEFQTRINNLMGSYETITNQLNQGRQQLWDETGIFMGQYDQASKDLMAANKEFDLLERRWHNWENAFDSTLSQLWGSLPGVDNSAKIRMFTERSEAYKSGLTYDEAVRTGQVADYWGSTVVTQLPNMVISMAVMTAGQAIGIPPIASSMIVGGVFGLSEQESVRYNMEQERNRSFIAEENLNDLTDAWEKGLVSDVQYYSARGNLRAQMALGRYSDNQISGMRIVSGLSEFAIASAFSYVGGGSIGNAQTNLARMGLEEAGEWITKQSAKSWYQHVGTGALNFGWELSTEVAEESLIYATNYFGGVGILDKEMDWSEFGMGIRETALSTVMSAGTTQGLSGGKSVIANLVVSPGQRLEVAKSQITIQGLLQDLKDPNLTLPQIESLQVQLEQEYKKLNIMDKRLQVRALIAGADGVDALVKAQNDLIVTYQEAGVNPGDSQSTIDKKVAAYRDGLSPKARASFDRRTQAALDGMTVAHESIDTALEADPMMVIGDLYGEFGTRVADELSRLSGWDNLSNEEKIIAVHDQMQEEQKNRRIDAARNDNGIMDYVEKIVYNGKSFEESGEKQRDIDKENQVLNFISEQIIIQDKTNVMTTLGMERGYASLESISSDPNFKDKIKVRNINDLNALYEEVKTRYDNGDLTANEYNAIVSGLKGIERDGKHLNIAGAFIGNEYITLATEEDARAAIEDGSTLPGTVVLHETSHLLDNLAGITGDTSIDYANKLKNALINSGDKDLLDLHDQVAVRLKQLGLKEGSQRWSDEYATSIQDIAGRYNAEGRQKFAALKNLAGKKSWTDIFRKKSNQDLSKGFEIKNDKDALNYLVAHIEGVRSGQVSKLTQSRIDAGLGENFTGASRMSAENRQASEDVQRIYEDEYSALPENKRKGSDAEGSILDLMKAPIANMARRVGLLTDWDNFDQENLESEIRSSIKKRGATSLIRDYDPRSAEYVLKDGRKINALVSKKGGLTVDGNVVENVDYYFKDVNNPTQGEIDTYITDQFGAIEKRNQVPLAGYVFQQLNLRMPEFINNAKLRTAEGFALNVDELGYLLGVEEDFSERADVIEGRKEGTILLANQLGPEGLAIAEMIVEDYEAGNINADNKTYKNLPVPDRVLDAVFEMMGINPLTKEGTRKTGNLDQTDVLNAQRWLDKNLQVFRNAVPLHHSTKMVSVPVIEGGKKKLDDQGKVVTRLTPRPDKATGIPKVILTAMFDQHSRKDNLASWKPKDMLDSEVKAIFGITKRGEQNLFTKDSNTSQRVRGAASLIAKAMVNQSVKIAKMAEGDGTAFSFEDGKNPALFSAEVRRMAKSDDKREQSLALEIVKGMQDPNNKSKLKINKGSILSIFSDEWVANFSEQEDMSEKMIMSRLNKANAEAMASFAKYDSVPPDASLPMIDRSLEDLAVDHIIDDATNHHQVYRDMVGEDDFLDLNDPDDRAVAAQGVATVANHLRNKRGSAWFNRFVIPGLTSSFNPKRGAIFVPPNNIDVSKRDWVRNELGVLMSNEDMKNIDMPPSNYMDGNLDNDAVRKQEANLPAINKAQRENNQAMRDLTDDLAYLVALNKSDPSKGITYAQATAIVASLNSNQQGLTRSSAILDGFPNKPFELVPAFNKDGSPKLDANGEQVMLGAVLEHATPALQINQASLRTIKEATLDMFDENGNRLTDVESPARDEFNDLMDNYITIYLPKKYDDMVNVNNKYTRPFWSKPSDSPFGRYYGPLMIALGMDLEIRVPSLGIVLGGDGGIKPSVWKKYNEARKDAIGNLAKGTDIATDQKTVNDIKLATEALYSAEVDRKGMTAWDFDDTLATTKSNVIFTKDGETKIVSAEDFAKQGADLIAEGWTPDFSEFNEVKGGEPGPMFEKAMERARKYGTENTFILTARPQEAAPAIKQFLDALGLNIPIENITGLANSTGEAKARWLLDKHAQGYNDIAFADDAMQNIEAVQKVFDQFDIKGKVELAKPLYSAELNRDFNSILEETMDVGKEKTFSAAKARQRGKNIGKFKFFLPPSAEDFKGLIYSFLGKGETGEKHHQWFKENLFDPYSKGMRRVNSLKQEISADIRAQKRINPDAKNKLKKKIPGTDYTYEQGIRVYNWIQNGIDVPGLSQADANALVQAVKNDAAIHLFADGIRQAQDKAGTIADPGNNWLAGTIATDVIETIDASRDLLLSEFNENADIIFSEQNLNKIEAVYGSNFREAMEDMLYRMKTGSTRNFGSNRLMNNFTQWLNGSVGTTMFFNARSAVLQMISNINFINWSDNNPLKAAKAFGNQKQYWSDVSMIFNSPWLKQRRAGIGTDLNAAELLKDLQGSKNPMKTAISHLLQLGFTPTQAADSLAIATGGATMYRNRLQTYLDQGMTQQEAEAKAFEDMQEIAEETQQSTRPDKISQQQASPLGKIILAFQNTPMQYNRLMKRAAQDLINGRGDARTHISKIIYYGGVQSAIFYGLQTALFSTMFGDDDEEETDEKKVRVLNGMVDSILRGAGIAGAVVSTVKNTIIEFMEQEEKAEDDVYYTEPDHAYTLIEALNLSPPVGIKARKLYGAAQTWEFNRDVIDHMSKLDIDNPLYDATFAATEAVTNIPLSRLHNKFLNIREALNSDNETWQRIAMLLGWSRWSFGIQNSDVMSAKQEVKEIKKQEAEERREQKKIEKEAEREAANQALIDSNIEEQQQQRDDGVDESEIGCAAINRSGKRCGKKVLPGQNFCTIHEEVPQQTNEVQCSHIKANGDQCKMKTKNKSGKCYYHD